MAKDIKATQRSTKVLRWKVICNLDLFHKINLDFWCKNECRKTSQSISFMLYQKIVGLRIPKKIFGIAELVTHPPTYRHAYPHTHAHMHKRITRFNVSACVRLCLDVCVRVYTLHFPPTSPMSPPRLLFRWDQFRSMRIPFSLDPLVRAYDPTCRPDGNFRF